MDENFIHYIVIEFILYTLVLFLVWCLMVFKWLDFKITNRCNNNCLYCGNQDPPDKPEKVTSKRIINTLVDALELGFTHFAFLGGEPSIRKNVEQLFTPLKDHGKDVQSVMAITNMHVFNEKLFRAVYESRSNHAQIVASIDSLKEPNYKNQKVKQTQSFLEKIQEISNEYQNHGLREVHVHSVISRENLASIYDHVKFFDRKNIQVSLALVEPYKIIKKPSKYNEFSPSEFELILKQLDSLEQDNILNWANQVLRNYLTEYIMSGNQNRFDCTAGRNHVIIESDGYVYPCLTEAYRRGLQFGNITQGDFKDIYTKMVEFKCKSDHQQTCWDHYLWTELDKLR